MRPHGSTEGPPQRGRDDSRIPAKFGTGLEVVGRCPSCLARCVCKPPDRMRAEQVFLAHQACCPGGNRSDVVWVPFGSGVPDQCWSLH